MSTRTNRARSGRPQAAPGHRRRRVQGQRQEITMAARQAPADHRQAGRRLHGEAVPHRVPSPARPQAHHRRWGLQDRKESFSSKTGNEGQMVTRARHHLPQDERQKPLQEADPGLTCLTQDKIAALKAAHGPSLSLFGSTRLQIVCAHGPRPGAASSAGPATLPRSARPARLLLELMVHPPGQAAGLPRAQAAWRCKRWSPPSARRLGP